MSRVSAIIIVFNGETYIAEAIDSVLAQDFDDWELLIVDDGSTDRTRDIVQSYVEAQGGRIRLLRHPDSGNHGMSANSEPRHRRSPGGICRFPGCRRRVAPGQAFRAGANARQPSFRGPDLRADPDLERMGPELGQEGLFLRSRRRARSAHSPLASFQLLENVHQTPTTCNAMVRRDLMLEVGGFDPSFRDMFEDQISSQNCSSRTPPMSAASAGKVPAARFGGFVKSAERCGGRICGTFDRSGSIWSSGAGAGRRRVSLSIAPSRGCTSNALSAVSEDV